MKIVEIQRILEATPVGDVPGDTEIHTACGSDMMSDVLAFPKERMVLLTGLVNAHVIRTCSLLDVQLIVFVRGKYPGEEIREMAKDADIALLASPLTLYEACGRLYTAGMHGGTGRPS